MSISVPQNYLFIYFYSYTVFHYQVKVHFFSNTKISYTDQPMKISLYGYSGEKENIPYIM